MAEFLSEVLQNERYRKSDFGFQRSYFPLISPTREFFALRPPRCAESKILYDERMVVLLLALLVDPIVGADLRLKNELIPLARMFGDGLAEAFECYEPNSGDGLARIAALILARIVVADETEARIGGIAFDGQFGI